MYVCILVKKLMPITIIQSINAIIIILYSTKNRNVADGRENDDEEKDTETGTIEEIERQLKISELNQKMNVKTIFHCNNMNFWLIAFFSFVWVGKLYHQYIRL